MHVHVAAESRSQASALQVLAQVAKRRLETRLLPRCANLSDHPLRWWKALVGICPGGMYSN